MDGEETDLQVLRKAQARGDMRPQGEKALLLEDEEVIHIALKTVDALPLQHRLTVMIEEEVTAVVIKAVNKRAQAQDGETTTLEEVVVNPEEALEDMAEVHMRTQVAVVQVFQVAKVVKGFRQEDEWDYHQDPDHSDIE